MKNIFCILSLFFSFGAVAQDGIITTIAGNGLVVPSGDGGPAISASIGKPYGCCVDSAGNLYITDHHNSRIRKVAPSGVISTFAGSSTGSTSEGIPATAASVNQPRAIVADGMGNIYFSETGKIRKVSPSGIITTVAGNGTPGYTGDGGPATAAQVGPNVSGIVRDNFGNIYFTDFANDVVRKIDASGMIATIAGAGVAGVTINGPCGIGLDALGNIYVRELFRVLKINTSGTVSIIVSGSTGTYSGDGGPVSLAQINTGQALALDQSGNIFFSDQSDLRIRRINSASIITKVAGNVWGYSGDSTIAKFANLGYTPSIATDKHHNLYICDFDNRRIRKVSFAPDLATSNFSLHVNRICAGIQISAVANSPSPLQIKTMFGDCTSDTTAFTSYAGGIQSANITHTYSTSGCYTLKFILLNGSTAIDSIVTTYNSLPCNILPVRFYNDTNSNCVKDSSELLNYLPITTEVDSNGTPVDTISSTGGFNYMATGSSGDIYTFRVLSLTGSLYTSCPSSGIITDTLVTGTYNLSTKYIGLGCASAPGHDMAITVDARMGHRRGEGIIIAQNLYCTPKSGTVPIHVSPKYVYGSSSQTPLSVVGNAVTWTVTDLSAFAPPAIIRFKYVIPGALLIPGDTIRSNYVILPTDINPGNNTKNREDTIRTSFDPNYVAVSPEGCIPSAGTQLEYTIHFENTGNDTAHNIYVMDTLSQYVIPSSMRIVASTAVMNVIPLSVGGIHVLKFDFPNIMLPDSSHHDLCNGMVRFTINTRAGLPDGTLVTNHAGIYFDDNDPVLTNTATNTVCIPVIPTTSITQPGNADVEMYPNPATNKLTIKSENAYESISISNNIGVTLIEKPLSGKQTTVNIETLPVGMYFVRLAGPGGIVVKKLVKTE